ncbi:leucine-rich repeat domain-containing protein [Roseovarius salinarum]|uniref:leucine-rich repeat domain-containing protein n=1 Tax=Roseovarius salinarum TaxID=1981892 RepID=UPI000C337A5D|nr:leucine-rich repeat domain-containing protein [Roseovarius salinarum]
MSDADEAYQGAERRIAKARERGDDKLDFDSKDFRALDRLPPEIGHLHWLRVLDLENTKIADITPLQGLGKLQGLDLSATQVADLAPLTGVENLQGLSLRETRVADIAALTNLENLQGLDLRQTRVADLRPIADLPRLGDNQPGGLRFDHAPAARATPELSRLSQIKNAQDRTRETLAYLKTLPPWPDPLPWDIPSGPLRGGDTGAVVKTAQAQIAFLLDHAATSQVTAETTASQIRHALREVPASDGNKLPPVLQTMLDVAQVLDRLAAAPIGPDNPDREAELTARIAQLEERVQTLTAQLADAESAREAAEALANTTGFWPSLRVAAGTSIGKQAGPLIHTGILSGTVYFLGTNHTFVQGLLRAIEALK